MYRSKLVSLAVVTWICFSLPTPSSGQSELEKTVTGPDKVKTIIDHPAEGRKSKNGGGWSVNLSMLESLPKRVGLVTFYVEDPGMSKQTKSTTVVTGSLWRTSNDKLDEHAVGFYNQGIDALKEAFDNYDMELLLPSEFCDTDDKKAFYESFEVKHGRLRQTKEKSKGITQAGYLEIDRYRAAGPGFRVMAVANEPASLLGTGADYKFKMDSNESALFQSMGWDLANGLGLDAVVAVYIVTRKPDQYKENYGVNHVSMYMWGPNPTQLSEEEDSGLKGKFYVRGQFYAGSRANFPKLLLFQSIGKKGTGSLPVYNGMEHVMTALTNRIGDYMTGK